MNQSERKGYDPAKLARIGQTRPGFWAVLGGRGASTTYQSGGLVGPPYAYAWGEIVFQKNPNANQTSPAPPPFIATSINARGGSINGSSSGKNLGPAYNLSEMRQFFGGHGFAQSPMLGTGYPTIVWMEEAFDNQTPANPIWVFDFPADDDVLFIPTARDTGFGQYIGTCLVGASIAQVGTNFAGSLSSSAPWGFGPWVGGDSANALGCNLCEMNLPGWRLDLTETWNAKSWIPAWLGKYKGTAPDGKSIVFFHGNRGMGTGTVSLTSGGGGTWNYYDPTTYAKAVTITFSGGEALSFDAFGNLLSAST